MMSRHFRLSSELSGAIAKRLPHAKNQLSPPCSFFNQFVTDIYTNRTKVFVHYILPHTNSTKLIFEGKSIQTLRAIKSLI